MVAVPFFLLMVAIVEIGVIFMLDSVLNNATVETGRLIRTGQAEEQKMTAAQFKTQLCSRMSVFAVDCETRASIDVQQITTFNPAPLQTKPDGSVDETKFGYTYGQAGSLIVVRVLYQQPLLTKFMEQALSRRADGKTVLTATTAFRNEPA